LPRMRNLMMLMKHSLSCSFSFSLSFSDNCTPFWYMP
jgi:hypothetical protein